MVRSETSLLAYGMASPDGCKLRLPMPGLRGALQSTWMRPERQGRWVMASHDSDDIAAGLAAGSGCALVLVAMFLAVAVILSGAHP